MFATSWVRINPRPSDVAGKVHTYLSHRHARKPIAPWFDEAVVRARRDYKLASKIRPLTISDSIKHFQHPETSPGIPFTQMGFRRKDDVPSEIIYEYVRRFRKGLWTKCAEPCNAVCRSQVAKLPKFRLIWVYPVHMIMAEGMFAQPFINAIIAKRGTYAGWVQYSRGDMRAIRNSRPRHLHWLGMDYKAFDQTVPPWLIRIAFDIIAENIDFTNYHGSNWRPREDELRKLWRVIVNYFINTPVKLPSGRVVVKHGGVPSGSFFTSLVDSVCSSIIKHAILCKNNIVYSQSANYEYGDDSLVAIARKTNVEDLIQDAEHYFGVELNRDKTEYGEYVSFLGYKMSPTGYPLANFDKLMAQLCLPEKPDKDIFDFITRMLALRLSCFGFGCTKFIHLTQQYLDGIGLSGFTPKLSKRSELFIKLRALDLADFPPLTKVMRRV